MVVMNSLLDISANAVGPYSCALHRDMAEVNSLIDISAKAVGQFYSCADLEASGVPLDNTLLKKVSMKLSRNVQ